MLQNKMQDITPDCLNFTGAVDVSFLVLVTNTVQIILQTFQQGDEEFLRILLTAHTCIHSQLNE